MGAEAGRTFTAEGPSLRLSPRDAQAIAMAVHELATNAGKYGALAAEAGRILVEWQIERSRDAEELRFLWRERGAAIPHAEAMRGFGSEVIERSVPHMLGGTAEFQLHPEGAECRIVFPLPRKEH